MQSETHYFYANIAKTAFSNFDVTIEFRQIVPEHIEGPSGPSAGMKDNGGVLVTMAVTHLKAMLPSLENLLRDYEAKFGPVPDVRTELDTK